MKDSKDYATNNGISAGIARVNKIRWDMLADNLRRQNLNNLKAQLEFKKLLFELSGKLQGSVKTKHGIIAEYADVHIRNARDLVRGNPATHFKEPDLASPIDYWDGWTPIQSKFLTGTNKDGVQTLKQTLTSKTGIKGHLAKYPDFLKRGGKYRVPQDQFNHAKRLLSTSESEMDKASYKLLQEIRAFESENGIEFAEGIEPSVLDYADVQRNAIDGTIECEKRNVAEIDKQRRAQFREQARPTFKEGAKVAGASAAIEGVAGFGFTLLNKLAEKDAEDFTEEDWEEIFVNAGVGAAKGGTRGAAIYALTNFGKLKGGLSSALVAAGIGVCELTLRYANGELSEDEYAEGLLQTGTETAITGVSAVIGQVLIPVPVVGAVVGSIVGSVILDKIKADADAPLREARLIAASEANCLNLMEAAQNSTQTFCESVRTIEANNLEIEEMRLRSAQLSAELKSLLN